MAEAAQRPSQAEDVVLDPTRPVEGVRADEPDPQPGHEGGCSRARGWKKGCSIGQSCGRRRIVVAKWSATCWVIDRSPSGPPS